MPDPNRDSCKGKLAGMVSVIFLAGMAAGAVGMRLVDRHWLQPPNPAFSASEKELAVQHFRRELSLDEQQARAIEAILDEFMMQQAELMTQFKSSRLSGHERIIQILNEEQRRRFQEVVNQLRSPRRD